MITREEATDAFCKKLEVFYIRGEEDKPLSITRELINSIHIDRDDPDPTYGNCFAPLPPGKERVFVTLHTEGAKIDIGQLYKSKQDAESAMYLLYQRRLARARQTVDFIERQLRVLAQMRPHDGILNPCNEIVLQTSASQVIMRLSENEEAVRIFHNTCGNHPFMKIADGDVDEVDNLIHEVGANLLRKRFPKSKHIPSYGNQNGSEITYFERGKDIEIRCYWDNEKFVEAIIKVPAEEYKIVMIDSDAVLHVNSNDSFILTAYTREVG